VRAVREVLGSLLDRLSEENRAMAKQLVGEPILRQAVDAIAKRRLDHFHLHLQYRVNNLVDGLVDMEIPQAAAPVKFLFQNAGFVESHFRRQIESIEGSACSADKTRTVMRALLRRLADGVPIQFDYGQEYTFHLPTTVFRTEAEIVKFFDALRRLHSGFAQQYVEAVDLIHQLARARLGDSKGAAGAGADRSHGVPGTDPGAAASNA